MIEVNPRDDWGDEQIDQAVDDFSDWAAGEESPLSISMAEHYLFIKAHELSEQTRQAILEYARDFGVDSAEWLRSHPENE